MQKNSNKLKSIIELFNKGEKHKAQREIKLLLNADTRNEDLLLLHAKISINMNEIEESNSSLKKLISLNSNQIEALKLLYVNYFKINKFNLAKKYIDKLLKIENNNYNLFRDKAYVEYLDNNFQESEIFIEKAIAIKNNEVFGLNILGLVYIKRKDLMNAISIFNKAVSINPEYSDSYNNLGRCYIELEKLNLAYYNFKKAYKLNPSSDLSLINIANILSLKDKNNAALKLYEKAKNINPNNKQADENIIICNIRLKKLKWVEKKFLNLNKSNNINSDITLGYAYLLLHNKRFQEGFNFFDARLKKNSFPEKNIYHDIISKHLSKKNNLEINKTVLVVKEQGVGDEILFSSMYNDLIKNFTNIKIECDNRLLDIFKRSFNKKIFYSFGHFSSKFNDLKNFNNVLYAGSLTKFFRKTEKDFKIAPYLKSKPELDDKFNLILNKFKNKKRIGVSWKSVVNIYGGLKSLSLNDFRNLLSEKRLIIDVQYGDKFEEINNFRSKGNNIFSFENIDLYNDFDSLISILKNLDVFVTVSNSTAHFAGALGVPTILICPKKSSTYYYWDYEDGKTPWYSSVSIVKFKNSLDYTMRAVNKLIDEM